MPTAFGLTTWTSIGRHGVVGTSVNAALCELDAVATRGAGGCARWRDFVAHFAPDLLELTPTADSTPYCTCKAVLTFVHESI